MLESPNLKKGEKEFIERFRDLHRETKNNFENKSIEEKIKYTLEEIKNSIENFELIKQEESFHSSEVIHQTTDILAEGIKIALNESVQKGIAFIYKINNPFLIDAFHDILINHFSNLLKKENDF